jgi:RNA polymerase sigma-70 factor (ECF subfamily)
MGAVRQLPGGRTLQSLPGGADRRPRAHVSDEELIAAIERGDGSSAGELYDRLVGVVDRTLYRIFGRREVDHDDLMQASFEQIVLTLAERKYARACSLATWASTIASHVGLNALRARRRARNVFAPATEAGADEIGPASTDGERIARARCEVERVRRHLAAMTPDRAMAVLLHDVMGHDLAEISVLTGVSVAAAQSRLVRGRRELNERLAKDEA